MIRAAELAGVPLDAPQWKKTATLGDIHRHGWNRVSDVGPVEYLLCDLDAPAAVLEWVDQWATGIRPRKGLFLSGNPGSGKTTLMKAVLHEVIETSKRSNLNWRPDHRPDRAALYVPMTKFVIDLGRRMSLESRKEFGDEFDAIDDDLNGVMCVSRRTQSHVVLLGLDDIGTEYSAGTDWVPYQLNNLLRMRGHNNMPTIATSNKAMALLGKTYGPAVGSYVYEAFTEVLITDQDRRR